MGCDRLSATPRELEENFFGWNAADFGWGADRTQNILWRLNHGELDNVNPKVVVLLAGTNNLGSADPAESPEAVVEGITRGIEAILKTIHDKAPNATVILMAVFPRNDKMKLMPAINKMNAKLAMLADHRTVRFLSINDKLAGPRGHSSTE